MSWMAHREEILSAVQALPGEIGLWLENTRTGEALTWQAHQPMEAASVIKLTIMAEAFRQREAGELDFAQEIAIHREDKLPSCGALTYLHDGLRVQVGDLVTLMIILSDNTATNLLIDLLGQERIQAGIQSLGFQETRLNRKLFRPELSAQGIQNYVSAAEMAQLLRALLQGTCVSPQADQEMLEILLNQRLNGKIPFYLHDRGIPCAHKTGEDDGITHDVGILYLPEQPVLLCFLSNHTEVPAAERVLQEIARWAAD